MQVMTRRWGVIEYGQSALFYYPDAASSIMEFQHIREEKRGRIAIIWLNRQDKLNSLTVDLVREMQACIDGLEPEETRVVLIRGMGKHFSSGADINGFRDLDSMGGLNFHRTLNDLVMKIRRFPNPVIAFLHGYSMGGGLEIAESADIRIASDSAVISQPEINIGINAGAGGNVILPRLVGRGRAMYLILTGDRISAQKASEIGLVDMVYPDATAWEDALGIAEKISGKPLDTMRFAKIAVNSAWESSIESSLELEAALFGNLFSSVETKERIAAFLSKSR